MFFRSMIILITALYTVMTFRMLSVYAGFEINEELIRLELCEKRNVPDSCCRGKCYLDKQIDEAAAEDDAQSNPNPSSSKENLQCHIFDKEQNQISNYSSLLFPYLTVSTASLSNEPSSPPPRTVI